MDAEEPEFSGETKLDPEHIPLDDVEIYLEKLFAISAERPLDDRTLITLRKLGALLWQRYQLSRVVSEFAIFFYAFYSLTFLLLGRMLGLAKSSL